MRRALILSFVPLLVALGPLCLSSSAEPKTHQLYEGVARPSSEVVTIILSGPLWGIRGGVAGAKIQVDGKWVNLKTPSQVLPGTYTIAVTALCAVPSPPPRDFHFGFAVFHASITAGAGDTVIFVSSYQAGESFPLDPGSETCYGHSFPHTLVGPFLYVDSATQAQKALTSETGKQRWQTYEAYRMTVPGQRSSMRLGSDDRPVFVYKASGPVVMKLFRFSTKGNNREFVSKDGMLMSVTRSEPPDNVTPDQSASTVFSYTVAPFQPLGPGEYAIVTDYMVYTFGVDSVSGTSGLGSEIQGAAKAGDVGKVQVPLKTNPNPVSSKQDRSGGTPLHQAAAEGRQEVVELLLADNADVNARDKNGFTPLHRAAFAGHRDVVELLLAHNADVNARASLGRTPLYVAAVGGRKDVVELLLAQHADVNARADSDMTPLHRAAGLGYKDVAELLLANHADVNARNDKGRTPLLEAMDFVVHKDVVELLLVNHADVNARDNEGNTPLHEAAAVVAGDGKEAVEMLLNYKADVNAKDNQGRTPLDRAWSKDVKDLLRQHGGH